MSLKAFHIIFIAVSILLAIGFGIWCMRAYSAASNSIYLAGSVLSLLFAVGLILYGIWFLKKLKKVNNL
ncbi:MAG: hypothetical protein D6814_15490 [Calditrichaeota bacterium]|nr:MAG: hypothetical protein D6814_15490 [Calditrichota bacterium]